MIFAIRDDDTSYFTTPDELENAYDFIKDGCISLSVVPFGVPVHIDHSPFGSELPFQEYDIAKNEQLVEYLRAKVAENRYEIMLHGYSHEYKMVGSQWQAEMLWKTAQRLQEEIAYGKEYLQKLLNCTIRVFVAPSNQIDAKGIAVLENQSLDYSGIIEFGRRKSDLYSAYNLSRRLLYRVFTKVPYAGVMKYRKHNELTAFKVDNYADTIMRYEWCKRHGTPFVLYTHYWDLNGNPEKKQIVKAVYDYALMDGAKLVSMSSCFDARMNNKKY